MPLSRITNTEHAWKRHFLTRWGQTYLSTNFNLTPSKKERLLIITKSLNLSLFIIFYFSTKYLIMLGKVADHGPHTNCTSHSLTFHPPMDLQPSFWASINNRESPSLDNPYILFANIAECYSRNTNIFQLCSLIFHKIYQGRNNNNNNVQKFHALCRTPDPKPHWSYKS